MHDTKIIELGGGVPLRYDRAKPPVGKVCHQGEGNKYLPAQAVPLVMFHRPRINTFTTFYRVSPLRT